MLDEAGMVVKQAVIPYSVPSAVHIIADDVVVGDLQSIGDGIDILISNSHAQETAKRLKVPLYQAGFPVYKRLGIASKVTIGYSGTLNVINEMGNLLIEAH
jgi:nitrogenase molybdenum-iron protein alpha/beta subunit